MFCFPCEQIVGCKACGDNVGVCGRQGDTDMDEYGVFVEDINSCAGAQYAKTPTAIRSLPPATATEIS